MLPVAILAGGLATRLRPVTERIPKSMVLVAGRPFIDHQLLRLRSAGVDRVVLCVGHLAEQLEQHVGGGQAYGLSVRYSHDGPGLVGTGGALRQALPMLGMAFFVLYGDSLLDVDFPAVEERFVQSRAPALMTVYRNRGQWDVSNVATDGDRALRYDKTAPDSGVEFIDYGLGVLSARVVRQHRAVPPWDLSALYRELSARGELAAYEAVERFYEIGSPRGLEETERHLQEVPVPRAQVDPLPERSDR